MQLEVISRQAEGTARATPILFVHGMWHGAWCWEEHFLPYFSEHGYNAYALNLRGHGDSEGRDGLRWHSLTDYVADVAQVVNELERPPVLVGNSMGGIIVQKYLENEQVPAAVLVASVPLTGVIPATLRVARRHPLAFLKANMTLSMYPIVSTPALYREAFFSTRLPENDLVRYHARVQDESYRAYLDMMILIRVRPEKVKTPMLVLGGRDDKLVLSAEVEATAKAYGTDAELFPDMGHGMTLDVGWNDVADRILVWLNERIS